MRFASAMAGPAPPAIPAAHPVMAGPDPAISAARTTDARVRPGHDGGVGHHGAHPVVAGLDPAIPAAHPVMAGPDPAISAARAVMAGRARRPSSRTVP